jgi:hypothetical protein
LVGPGFIGINWCSRRPSWALSSGQCEEQRDRQVMGYNIQRIFSGVFAAGAASRHGWVMISIFNSHISGMG